MNADRSNWQVAAESHDLVGEGPLWSATENALYWVDVLGQRVNRLSLANGGLTRWEVAEPIGFIVLRRDQPGFIAGLRSGFHALQLEPFSCKKLGDPEPHLHDNRLNDGKVDGAGRLWAGTMPIDGASPTGTLYRVDPDLCWHAIDTGYHVTNGPAFSPAQDRLYHADSPLQIVFQFDLDSSGRLSNKRPFVHFASDWGYPDGMTVDVEGFVWIAHWDGGRISRFDPDGVLDRTIRLPASRITSCAFGGSGLDRLFVTSAREGRDHEPLAGALFEVEPVVAGIRACAFAG